MLPGGVGVVGPIGGGGPVGVLRQLAHDDLESSQLQISQLHRLFEELQMLRLILDSHTVEQTAICEMNRIRALLDQLADDTPVRFRQVMLRDIGRYDMSVPALKTLPELNPSNSEERNPSSAPWLPVMKELLGDEFILYRTHYHFTPLEIECVNKIYFS